MPDTSTRTICANAESLLRLLHDDTGVPQTVMRHITEVCAERDRLRKAVEDAGTLGNDGRLDEALEILSVAVV